MLRHRSGSWLLLLLVAAMTFALWPASAFAHSERPTKAPDGTGTVPVYRTTGPHLVVCKSDTADFTNRIGAFATDLRIRNLELYAECLDHGYRDLQAAVDHVTDAGTTIYVLPGIYLEEPSLAPESDACNHLAAPRAKAGYQILSYEQQKSCPHQQNLVGIFGIKDLQIEGTGAAPADVVFDAQFQKLNVIRGDRTNGLYLRNFIAQRSTFNAVYVIETDGFVIDNMIGRWNTEYGFLAFASDHGLITKCEAYGNGDSGVYPGGTSDINRDRGYKVPRYAIEVTGCHSHDNLLGYSGTGGDSVWVHDNEFDHNTGGASMDSLFPNHPGLPQNHALFEHNLIHSNNSNYYGYVTDGTCARPFLLQGVEKGVVCPAVQVPVGTGILVIGGNYNVFRNNYVYDNWKIGIVQTWVPGIARNDTDWSAQGETSHNNRYLSNVMGTSATGQGLPNGIDYFWDGEGTGNCWETATTDVVQPQTLPRCSAANPMGAAGGPERVISDPNLLVLFVECSNYDLSSKTLPAGCDWFTSQPRPGTLGGTLNTEAVAPAAQLVAMLLLFIWLLRRSGKPGSLAVVAAVAAAVGSGLLMIASVAQFYYLAAPGIAILGIGWLAAVRLVPTQRLAVLTLVLGIVALLEALDSGVVMLPSPIGPVWVRVVLEVVWVVWTVAALVAAARSRRPEAPPAESSPLAGDLVQKGPEAATV